MAISTTKTNTDTLAEGLVHLYYTDARVETAVTTAGFMVGSNNLSELTNVTTAKSKLGLATVATSGAYTDLSGRPANTDALSEGFTNLYFTQARAISSVLSTYVVGAASVVTTTDTVVQAIGKLQAQINANETQYIPLSQKASADGVATLDASGKLLVSQLPDAVLGAVVYQGVWNASTNSPTLASGVGTKGWYYKVNTAGTTTIDGNSQWNVGDMIIFNGTTWDKIDGISSEVVSWNDRVGAITLLDSDVTTALGYTPYDAANPSGYISGNQGITLNGFVTGTGTTTITTTLGATVTVAQGGTGSTTLTSGNYLVGAGTSAVTTLTPAQVATNIGAELTANKNVAQGYAGLNASSEVTLPTHALFSGLKAATKIDNSDSVASITSLVSTTNITGAKAGTVVTAGATWFVFRSPSFTGGTTHGNAFTLHFNGVGSDTVSNTCDFRITGGWSASQAANNAGFYSPMRLHITHFGTVRPTVLGATDANNCMCIIISCVTGILNYPAFTLIDAQFGSDGAFVMGGSGWTAAVTTDISEFTSTATPIDDSVLPGQITNLYQNGANEVDMRNGINPQAMVLYTTYTDASNYEGIRLLTTSGGGVSLTQIRAGTGNPHTLSLGTGSTNYWNIGASGAFTPNSNNTLDFGAVATLVRTYYGGGGISLASAAKTAAYTVTVNDFLVTGDSTSAAFTITLPAIAANKAIYVFKKVDATSNAITISGAATIDGASSVLLTVPNQWLMIQSNGTTWSVIGSGPQTVMTSGAVAIATRSGSAYTGNALAIAPAQISSNASGDTNYVIIRIPIAGLNWRGVVRVRAYTRVVGASVLEFTVGALVSAGVINTAASILFLGRSRPAVFLSEDANGKLCIVIPSLTGNSAPLFLVDQIFGSGTGATYANISGVTIEENASIAEFTTTVTPTDESIFVASGASAAPGQVPSPGTTSGALRFLREDSTWAQALQHVAYNSLPATTTANTVVGTDVVLQNVVNGSTPTAGSYYLFKSPVAITAATLMTLEFIGGGNTSLDNALMNFSVSILTSGSAFVSVQSSSIGAFLPALTVGFDASMFLYVAVPVQYADTWIKMSKVTISRGSSAAWGAPWTSTSTTDISALTTTIVPVEKGPLPSNSPVVRTGPLQVLPTGSGPITITAGNGGAISHQRTSDSTGQLDINSFPLTSAGSALFRYHRTTTGVTAAVQYLRGDGSSTVDHTFQSGGTTGATAVRASIAIGGYTGIGGANVAGTILTSYGSTDIRGPIKILPYTVATVPSVSTYSGYTIFVSDAAGGASLATSNGTNWISQLTGVSISSTPEIHLTAASTADTETGTSTTEGVTPLAFNQVLNNYGLLATATPVASDLNTFDRVGMFFSAGDLTGGGTTANCPPPDNYGYGWTLGSGTTYCIQVFLNSASTKMYTRSCSNGTWSSWVVMASTSVAYNDYGNTSSATTYLDMNIGPVGTLTVTEDTDINVANWPASGYAEYTMEIINGGAFTVTFNTSSGATTNWIKTDGTTTTSFASSGIVLQSSGSTWLKWWTHNGGSTIFASLRH